MKAFNKKKKPKHAVVNTFYDEEFDIFIVETLSSKPVSRAIPPYINTPEGYTFNIKSIRYEYLQQYIYTNIRKRRK